LPRFELAPVLELDGLAHDGFTAFDQGREVLPHRGERHAHLLGDLEVQALSVSLEALKGFGHGDMSSGVPMGIGGENGVNL